MFPGFCRVRSFNWSSKHFLSADPGSHLLGCPVSQLTAGTIVLIRSKLSGREETGIYCYILSCFALSRIICLASEEHWRAADTVPVCAPLPCGQQQVDYLSVLQLSQTNGKSRSVFVLCSSHVISQNGIETLTS